MSDFKGLNKPMKNGTDFFHLAILTFNNPLKWRKLPENNKMKINFYIFTGACRRTIDSNEQGIDSKRLRIISK